MGQTVAKDISSQFPDAESANLLSAERKLGELPFEALCDEPMLSQSSRIHTPAIIKHSNRCTLPAKIRGQKNRNAAGTSIEGISDQFLDSLVWACV